MHSLGTQIPIAPREFPYVYSTRFMTPYPVRMLDSHPSRDPRAFIPFPVFRPTAIS